MIGGQSRWRMCAAASCRPGTIGYWVGEPHAHRGHMTTALRVLLADAVRRAQSAPASRLPAFRPIPRRSGCWRNAGFNPRGAWRGAILCINGVWQDHLLFGMLHEDFSRLTRFGQFRVAPGAC